MQIDQVKLEQLTKEAEEAVVKYARKEISKQECSDAQRKLMDFQDGKTED